MNKFDIGTQVSWDSSVGKVSGIVNLVVTDGKVPNIGIDIVGTSECPAYLLKLLNPNANRGDVFVGKIHTDLAALSPANLLVEFKEKETVEAGTQSFPVLTKQQIAKLNKFRPQGFPLVKQEEMVSAQFVVADNLINRSKGKWKEKDLVTMAKMLDRMGLPHILNHDWEAVEGVQGLIIEGKIFKSEPPADLLDVIGNGEANRQIVKKEGFFQVVATVAFPADSPTVQKMSMGMGRAVSLGGFSFRDYVCPVCDTSFSYKNCPHYIPDNWMDWDADPALVAPYFVRDGLYDLGELSTVVIANLPGASLVTAGDSV